MQRSETSPVFPTESVNLYKGLTDIYSRLVFKLDLEAGLPKTKDYYTRSDLASGAFSSSLDTLTFSLCLSVQRNTCPSVAVWISDVFLSGFGHSGAHQGSTVHIEPDLKTQIFSNVLHILNS